MCNSGGFQILRRQDESGVIRVNISVFDVFRDEVIDDDIIFCDGVYFNFFGIFDVFSDDDWVIFGNICSLCKIVFEIFFGVDCVYGGI